MDEQIEIKESFLTVNTLFIRTIIIMAICLIAMGVTGFTIYDKLSSKDIDVDQLSVCGPVCIAAFVILSMNLNCLIDSIKGMSLNKKMIGEHGMDELLDMMNNKAIYVYAEHKKPRTIITSEYIFERNIGIYDARSIDYIYYRDYKGTTSIRMFDINDKCFDIARGIFDELKKLEVIDAIRKTSPNVLAGFAPENRFEHNNRVKANRASKKNKS